MRIQGYFRTLLFMLIFIGITSGYSESPNGRTVKSKTFYQYDPRGETGSDAGVRISNTTYNPDGKIQEHFTYDHYGNVMTREARTYDDMQHLTETVTHAAATDVTKKMVYSYNGDILLRADSYTDNNLTVVIEYQYNEDGKLKKMISRSPDSQITFNTENVFNSEGNLVETRSTLNGQPVGNTGIRKTASGNITAKIGRDGDLLQSVEKRVDDKGRLKETIFYDASGRITNKTSNNYDEQGHISEVINEIPSADIKTRKVRTYNDDGQMIEEIHYNKNDVPVKGVRVVYDYYE